MTITVGSLCTGYGGLEQGLHLAGLETDVRWHADNDPAATRLLAHRHPGIPNHGDITTVDWATVQPVDLICFGFPCQDLSYAGHGTGITKGNRSGLFHDCWTAVRLVRPRYVFMENVPAMRCSTTRPRHCPQQPYRKPV